MCKAVWNHDTVGICPAWFAHVLLLMPLLPQLLLMATIRACSWLFFNAQDCTKMIAILLQLLLQEKVLLRVGLSFTKVSENGMSSNNT
jgi:hypothetical protein